MNGRVIKNSFPKRTAAWTGHEHGGDVERAAQFIRRSRLSVTARGARHHSISGGPGMRQRRRAPYGHAQALFVISPSVSVKVWPLAVRRMEAEPFFLHWLIDAVISRSFSAWLSLITQPAFFSFSLARPVKVTPCDP